MIWNQWRRASMPASAELLAAARSAVDEGGGPALAATAIEEQVVRWTLAKATLAELAARIDPERSELPEDWEDEIGDTDADAFVVVLDVERDADGGMRLTWEPRTADNEAVWPIAWLVVDRFVQALGAEPVTVSAKALLDAPQRPIGAPPLPVVVPRAGCVLPTGRAFPLAIEDERSLAAVDRALTAHEGWCIAAVSVDPDGNDLEDVGCIARVVKQAAATPSSRVVFLAGAARIELEDVDEGADGEQLATGRVVEEGEPHEKLRALLVDASDQLLTLTIPQDDMPDDALEVLQQLPATKLADGAMEIFSGVLDASTRTAVLLELDPSERAMLLLETMSGTIDAIHDALDEHDGDLHAARLALLEDAVADAESELGEDDREEDGGEDE